MGKKDNPRNTDQTKMNSKTGHKEEESVSRLINGRMLSSSDNDMVYKHLDKIHYSPQDSTVDSILKYAGKKLMNKK